MRMCDIYNTPESIVFQEKKKKKKIEGQHYLVQFPVLVSIVT